MRANGTGARPRMTPRALLPKELGMKNRVSSPSLKANRKPGRGQSDSGQIIIEYILLLIIAVTVAAIITRAMIGRGDDGNGWVLDTWAAINTEIGKDKADDIKAGPD